MHPVKYPLLQQQQYRSRLRSNDTIVARTKVPRRVHDHRRNYHPLAIEDTRFRARSIDTHFFETNPWKSLKQGVDCALYPVPVLQLLRQVGVRKVLEAEGREGLNLCLFLRLDHQLQLATPRLILLDEGLLSIRSTQKMSEDGEHVKRIHNNLQV